MAIINKDNYYYIESYNDRNSTAPEPKIRYTGWPGQAVRNWDDKDYWYVEFINGDAFYHNTIEKLAGTDILNKIRNGQVTLCVSNSHEAYHYVIGDIYHDLVINQRIPASNILYLTNSMDIDKEIEIVSTKLNYPKIKSEYISLFEKVAQDQIEKNKNAYAAISVNKSDYDKKFISLNGLWRPHRLLLVSLLESLNVREQGYVSLNASSTDLPSMTDMFGEMINWTNDSTIKQLLLDNRERLMSLNQLYLDTDPNNNWTGAVYNSLDKNYYENTYFSVVTETLCAPNFSQAGNTLGRAISEKTFKPILNRHPFMILGVTGVLRLLRQLGYRTFSPYIDESYDDEPDFVKRSFMIAKETERLCSLRGKDLQDFLINCRSIVEHNFKVLSDKSVFTYPMT
jgi:hypothetical protein